MLQTVEYCTINITVHTVDIVPSFSIKITSFNVLLRGTGYKRTIRNIRNYNLN